MIHTCKGCGEIEYDLADNVFVEWWADDQCLPCHYEEVDG